MSYECITFVSETKRELLQDIVMTNEKTYNRTTKNGTEWMIVPSFFGGYTLLMKNYKGEYQFSGYTFKSIEEVNKHLDKVDENCSMVWNFTQVDCSSFYNRGSNVYYGD